MRKAFRIQSLCMALGIMATMLFAAIQTVNAQYVCQLAPGAPTVVTGSITAADPQQTSRVFRDGVPRGCAGGLPTQAPIAGAYRHDVHNFTNTTGQTACVVVEYNFTGCGANTTQINGYSPTFNPANVLQNLVGSPAFSSTGGGNVLLFSVPAGASFALVVHEVTAGAGCANYTFTMSLRTGCRQAGFDRSNDGLSDVTVYRPGATAADRSAWHTINSAGGTLARNFGAGGDIPTAADYTGDGQTDLSVYRPSNNTWYWATDQTQTETSFVGQQWGTTGDVPVPGDYDKDGKSDVAIWRPSDGTWYILRSSNNSLFAFTWGANGDTPVVGDYDGDLSNDFGVVRTVGTDLVWFVRLSNFGYGFNLGCASTVPLCNNGVTWGTTGDKLVPGDFNGDSKSDLAVWRPSTGNWHIRFTTGTNVVAPTTGINWGTNGDIPQPADYDGDKIHDVAVFRPNADPAQNFWFIRNSATVTLSQPEWGQPGDQPASSPYRITP